MRVVENRELPTFAEGIRSGGDGNSKQNTEHDIVKPMVVKPKLVPQISFSMFASPEAQKALECIDDDESEEEEEDGNKNDNSKVENGTEEADEDSDKGKMSRYKWRVVTKNVAACSKPRNTNSKSPSSSLEVTDTSSPRRGRRGSLTPDHRCLSPVPPRFPRSRRMSLSPSRHPLLPNRPFSPAPLDIHKTSSDPDLEMKSSSNQELNNSLSPSSPRGKIDVAEGNPAIARALSRRRFSLPVSSCSSRTSLLPPHPPPPRSRVSSPSPSTTSSTKTTLTKKTSSVTSTLQANRAKLEALMKERSKAIENLKIGHGSRESIPSPTTSIPKSPAPIRAKHSIAPPSLSRRSSIASEPELEASQTDTTETISLLDGEAVNLDAMVADVIDMKPDDVTSMKSEPVASPRSLTSSPLRLVGGARPVFQRRGSSSYDSGISLGDTSSVSSEQDSASSKNHLDTEVSRLSRLRNRRGTICVASLQSLLAPMSSEPRSSSSSPRPSQRSKDDIQEDVEEELQKRIMQRKSQLLIQAASGSSNMRSAVRRTTNGRLKKIMGNLTLERTTAELLTMKAAMNATARREANNGIQKSKSLECD